MTLSEHKKHANITRPLIGNFARNEWAIVGGPCTVIKVLAQNIIAALSATYQCAYADTAHQDDMITGPGRLAAGAAMEYTDQLNFARLDLASTLTLFQQRQLFSQMDLVLVNGNHQQAVAQVVIIDANKQASLQKRAEQLTNVQLILLADNKNEAFDFLKDKLPANANVPVLRLNDTGRIIAFFKAKIEAQKPVLRGLVLAGGESRRMGTDKGKLNWHGKEQRYHAADLLKTVCSEVYISCRDAQQAEGIDDYPVITDTFTGLGPYGAILSAFREQPDAAWLVLACDLPLIDVATLQQLAAERDTSCTATTFHSDTTGFPEPLITIWEPKSYPIMLQFLAQGYSCPRKVLINSNVKQLKADNADALTNVNTPDEMERVKRIIHQKLAHGEGS